MLYAPDTETIDMPTLHAELNMPYTLTPGRAAGTFLAEIYNKRIVGTRFKSGLTIAPGQDFSHIDGEDEYEFVEAPATGRSANSFLKGRRSGDWNDPARWLRQ